MALEDLIREAQDPSTTAGRLAELAQADRATWPSIVVHPAAYPGLLDWLGQQGDATVNAVLALRSASAGTPAPTQVIPPVTPEPTPAAEPVAPAEVVGEAPTVTQPVVPAQPVEPSAPAYAAYPTTEYPVAATPAYGSVPPTGDGAAPLSGSSDGDGGSGKKNFWLLAAMVAVVLVLIGGVAFGATQVFGGDDDDKEEASTSQTTDADEPTDEPDDEPTIEPSDEPTEAPEPDDSGSGGGEFCEEFSDVQDETMDSMGGTTGTDLGKLTESLGRLAEAYSDLEDAAPGEIKSDVAVMADYFDTFKDPMNVDPSDINGKLTEFTGAAQKVTKYYYSNCI